MATGQTDASLELSTGRAVRDLGIVLSVIGGIWVTFVLFSASHYGRQVGMRMTGSPFVAAISIPLVLAAVLPAMAVTGLLGRTVIDEQGVWDRRIFRQAKKLTWVEIRRVRWMPRSATLRGEHDTITIFWELEKSTVGEPRAREIVRRHLGPRFDLSDSPPPQRAPFIASLTRVGLAAVVLWTLMYLAYRQAVSNPVQTWWKFVVLSPILMILPLSVWTIARQYRDPDGPLRWRTRRHDSSPPSAA